MLRLMSNRRGDPCAISGPFTASGCMCDVRRDGARAGHHRPRRLTGALTLALALASGAARAASPEPVLPAEPAMPGAGVEADYLRSLHIRIHPRWVGRFMRDLAGPLPPTSPFNNPTLQAVVQFSVRWDGTPTDVTLVGKSGVAAFDQAAREAILKIDSFPPPPVAVLSDDRLAHFRWVFARDDRGCTGGEVRRIEEPLAEALPHLLIQGRVEEALWRLARHAESGEATAQDPLQLFARAWLARPQGDPINDGRAAAALARAGDAKQVPRLRVALGHRDTVAVAASALRELNVEICPLVEQNLGASDPAAQDLAMQALSAAGGSLPPTSPCVQVLATFVQDPARDGRRRALAAHAVAAISADGARRLLTSLLADPDPAVRSAAVSLLARPGGGRPALYRWLPFLHDPAIEVRAAAAAALVRCCGDLALDQLVLVWKEPLPQVAVAVANELGRMTSAPSEAFLVRLSKRRDPAVRAATAEAMLARRDLGAPVGGTGPKDNGAKGNGTKAAKGTALAKGVTPAPITAPAGAPPR